MSALARHARHVRRRYRGFASLLTIALIVGASASLHAQDRPCPKMDKGGGGTESVGDVAASGTAAGIDDHPRVTFAVDGDDAKRLAVRLQQDNPRGRFAMTLFRQYEHDGRTQWRKIARLARFETSGAGETPIKLPPGRYTLVFTGRDMRYAVTLRESATGGDESTSSGVIASKAGRL